MEPAPEHHSIRIVLLNKKNVTKKIRSQLVNKYVSEISAMKSVRTEMVKRQRELALQCSLVMDGRDIGSVVLKDANLKLYLTASTLERAKRRRRDLNKLGENISIRKLSEQIIERDNYDSSRKISPLAKPHDAIVIDTTNLTISNVINQILFFLPKTSCLYSRIL